MSHSPKIYSEEYVNFFAHAVAFVSLFAGILNPKASIWLLGLSGVGIIFWGLKLLRLWIIKQRKYP